MTDGLDEPCVQCGHPKRAHAVFIDNSIASMSYKEERRHCLHGDLGDCDCKSFVSKLDIPKRMVGAARGEAQFRRRSSDPGCGQIPSADSNHLKEHLFNPDLGVEFSSRIKPICAACVNSKYPGIVWPYYDKAMGEAFIKKCGACDLFICDFAAAYFLSAVLGLPIQLGMCVGKRTFFTPIDVLLVESISKALRIG